MSDERRRRPPSIHPGPAPREPVPESGMRQVIFHFDTAVPATSVSLPDAEAAAVRDSVGHAWNSRDGQMFTVSGPEGRPLLLVNLGKVRAVEIR